MRNALIVLTAAALLGACARKAEIRDVKKLVDQTFDKCPVAEVKNVKIESDDRKTVRFSYVLRIRFDGTMKGVPCPMPTQKLLEAHFNKDFADLKIGDETTVTQEATREK
jgi:hypothetical protein